jgi:hypothetical protein
MVVLQVMIIKAGQGRLDKQLIISKFIHDGIGTLNRLKQTSPLRGLLITYV